MIGLLTGQRLKISSLSNVVNDKGNSGTYNFKRLQQNDGVRMKINPKWDGFYILSIDVTNINVFRKIIGFTFN